uniref:Uncharacterized protein n=1 Tax=Arsenophonus endosymbiont of Trialeurodes vaporariorum TaxID=235567 RepID=A0A3B0M8A7_9GAMM
MKMPRLTDERRCQSKEDAIAYAIQQMDAIRQGKEPLSPSMKEKRQAIEIYDKEAKELQQFISNLQPAKKIIMKKYNPEEDTSDRGYSQGRYMGD